MSQGTAAWDTGFAAWFRPLAVAGWGLVTAAFLGTMPVARGAVELVLRIPEAETYVLGDAIPLLWRFQNGGGEPLGFMWEGCCRLNGKLEVRRVGTELPTVPPGQALAHMFAKADRLDPGIAKEYDTRVSDWVQLPGTGTYDLRGTYRGVLPTQFPQVPRGLALWREAAVSPVVRLEVLSVEDYLAERGDRVRRGGLRVSLEGPAHLSPLEPRRWRVTFENQGDRSRRIPWPDGLALWVIRNGSDRVAPAAVLTGPTEMLEVPTGTALSREFEVEPDRFEGEAFDDYVWFVDVASLEGRPRVPSNPHPVTWRWSAEELRDLVHAAARGAGTGARNAPLKRLRVHLGEVGHALDELHRRETDPAAAALAGRLAFAARIRPLRPTPGLVVFRCRMEPDGTVGWESPRLTEALTDTDRDTEARRAGGTSPDGAWESSLTSILGVRRHLGWEVGVEVVPAPATPLSHLHQVAARLEAHLGDLSGPLTVVLSGDATVAPPRVEVVGVGEGEVGSDVTVLRIGSDRRVGVRGTLAVDLVREEDLVAWGKQAGFPLRVAAESGLPWGVFESRIRPLLGPGARLILVPWRKG